jgi:N6-L-threonylcarbamoyladenine synthase
LILALETSCDDTCAAVVTDAGEVRSSIVSSQGVHDRFGGVVPEIASRHHLELVNAVVDDALRRAGAGLDDISLIAVTQGPGLVGALLGRRGDGQGARGRAAAAAGARRPPAGTRRANFLAPMRSSRPSSA